MPADPGDDRPVRRDVDDPEPLAREPRFVDERLKRLVVAVPAVVVALARLRRLATPFGPEGPELVGIKLAPLDHLLAPADVRADEHDLAGRDPAKLPEGGRDLLDRKVFEDVPGVDPLELAVLERKRADVGDDVGFPVRVDVDVRPAVRRPRSELAAPDVQVRGYSSFEEDFFGSAAVTIRLGTEPTFRSSSSLAVLTSTTSPVPEP